MHCHSPAGAAISVIEGAVIRVKDGDTLVLQPKEGKPMDIRLTEIDAPEKRQPWGDEAREALAKLVQGKVVRVKIEGKDHGRSLGRVYLGSRDINAAMVQGAA